MLDYHQKQMSIQKGKGKMKKYSLKGINDEQDVCQHCGKTGLKRVAWLVEVDTDGNEAGDLIAVGIDCAGKLLGWNKSRTLSTQTTLLEFERTCEKAVRLTASYPKVQIIDWLRRLHWHLLAEQPSEEKLVLTRKVESATLTFRIW